MTSAVFEIGTLDQGFWPDGIYTAPTDEALRSDIEFLKKAGFNLTRKHVKVEPDRWYYWCDKLGLLVWQDMPSGNNATADGRRDFENELLRMVDGLDNHPSIIVWVLFNEGWGQYDTEPLAAWLKELDPSRLVDDASGWTDMRAGDLIDMHNYPGPDAPAPEPHRAAVLGEFGGLGLAVEGHIVVNALLGLCHADQPTVIWRTAMPRCSSKSGELHNLRGLSAAVYTQTADVETECNGLQTYDRAVAKIDPAVLLAANRGEFCGPPMKIILADALVWPVRAGNTPPKNPPMIGMNPSLTLRHGKKESAGLALPGTPGIFLNTTWNTADIWLRRDFTLKAEDISGIKFQIFHDEDVEIYLNGVLAAKLSGFITDYDEFEISQEALAALHPGDNTIAVHCHQTTGGQGIDVGILVPGVPEKTTGN